MDRTAPPPDAIQLRISLTDIDPPIWRRFIVRRDTTLHELHRSIQILFDWYDYHLYEFEVGRRRFQASDEESEAEDSTKTKLYKVISEEGQVLEYTYDFGDSWLHRIEVENLRVPAGPAWLPYLIEGERSGPPEDCGGPPGYMRLVAALRTPYEDLEEEDRSLVDWVDPEFDPDEFNVMQARHALMLTGAWGALRRR